jgi:hypothetical protein
MTFLQPHLLWALPLILVPVLIHFLNRMRYRTVPWAAMMFLLAATRQSVRHAKLRELLLLACRVGAILCLIFFLARPIAGGWLGWAFHGAPDTVVLLLDRSPSLELNQLRATAVARLAAAAAELSGRTRFVLMDSATRKPTDLSAPALLAELPQTQPSDASADIPALLQAAVDYVATSQSGRTEFWLASDLQTGDWQPDNAARWAEVAARIASLPQDIRVRLLALRPDLGAANVSVTVADARRRKTGGRTELLLTLDLQRNHAAPTDIPVTIVVEGARTRLNVQLEGPTLRLQHKLDLGPRTSRGWGFVELPADANVRDNTAYFVFDGERHLQTIVAASDPALGRLLALAAAPAPDLLNQSSRALNPLEFPPADVAQAALVIYQGHDPDRVRAHVSGGGLALVLPARDAGTEFTGRVTQWRTQEGPLAHSDDGEELPVRDLTVSKRVDLAGKGTGLAAFDDGAPFLTRETIGKGERYWLATLPERGWSSLAEGSVLVPVVQRLVRDGGRRLGAVGTGVCGVEPLGDARRLDKETGRGEAGIYQRGAELVALNRPGSEDVPDYAETPVVKNLFGNVPVRVFEDKDSTGKLAGEIWRLFVWLMLLALIGEAMLTLAAPATKTRPAGVPKSREKELIPA